MNFKCVKSDLLDGIQIVQRAISSKTTLPILSGILFDLKKDKLILSATDLEISIKSDVKVKTLKEGSLVVPAKLIENIIRYLPESTIEIRLQDKKNQIQILCEQTEFFINTVFSTDFPKIPELEAEVDYKIKTKELIDGAKKVIRATSKDETRLIFTGVLLKIKENLLNLVATDSYRLAAWEAEGPEETKNEIEIIIPARALEELIKIISIKSASEIRISLAGNQIMFALDDVCLISRLIEGQFPDYKKLLPQEYEIELSLERQTFADAIKRISLLAQGNLPLKIDLSRGQTDILAETQEIGQAKESLRVDYQGKEIQISFNPQYLLDGLNSTSEEMIRFKLIDALKPGLIETPHFQYLIMPVRMD